MENDSARPSGSSRLIALLDAVALAGGRLRYRDAARALAPISPNTVARLLRELVSARVLERNAGGYRLGDRPVFWAVSVPLERDLRHLARPVLTRLSGELGLTACMAARMDGHVTIIDRIVSADGPTLMPPGTFRPITIATIGGPLFMDPADLADPGRWAASLRTVRVHGDQEALRRLLMAGVKRGLLDDGGLIHADLRRLTAPILRDGRIVACLTVAGRPHRLADARLRRRAMRLLRAAADRLAIGASAGR